MRFRKAIFIIHGFAGGTWDHQYLANELQFCKNFDVFNITLPGHDKLTLSHIKRQMWIKAVEDYMDMLISHGYKQIYVIGHSMGGILATHLAGKYKEVKKLVLLAPAFRYLIFKEDKFKLISSLKEIPKILKDYDSSDIVTRIKKMPLPVIFEFMNLAKEHYNDIKKVTCKTLIIQGNNDLIVPKSSSLYIHNECFSKVNILVTLDNVNHDVINGKRGEFITVIIKKFLKKKIIKKQKKIIEK